MSADRERSHPFLLFQPTSCTGAQLTVRQMNSTHVASPLFCSMSIFFFKQIDLPCNLAKTKASSLTVSNAQPWEATRDVKESQNRIIVSFRLENTSRITKSNYQPLPHPPINHVPMHPICTSFEDIKHPILSRGMFSFQSVFWNHIFSILWYCSLSILARTGYACKFLLSESDLIREFCLRRGGVWTVFLLWVPVPI